MTTASTGRRRGGAALVLTALLVSGCADADADADDAQASPSAEPTTASRTTDPIAPTGGRLPDGTWSRVATAADARAFGIPAADSELGPDGRLPLVLRIEGDRWTLLGEFQPGHLEAGDLGSLAYEDGYLVTTSDSEGCPGCVSQLTWSRHGDTVALERVTGPSVVAMDRFIWLGRWQRA